MKYEIIKIKKEELNCIDNIAKLSSTRKLSEKEKLEVYQKLESYKEKLKALFEKYYLKLIKDENKDFDFDEVIIKFNIDKSYLSSIKDAEKRKSIMIYLDINPYEYTYYLTYAKLRYYKNNYNKININYILNNQSLSEKTIYIFMYKYYYDEDTIINEDHYAIYFDPLKNEKYTILESEIKDFEKNKIIIYPEKYISTNEILKVLDEELLNKENETINDCITKTKLRIKNLSYKKSPEYKEEFLLKRINELYQRVKGTIVNEETLFQGNFLKIKQETYKLPNNSVVKKEKVVKNNGKDSVIVIAITKDFKYIITIQNRINNKLIAEFPSGYIEDNENPLDAAKRELQEETSYKTDSFILLDEAYTSPGIDNSKTYIVLANNCIKTDELYIGGTELVDYELFTEKELKYLIYKNIMNGAMNKLAYYNLITNTINCNTFIMGEDERIYKRLRKKKNPFNN